MADFLTYERDTTSLWLSDEFEKISTLKQAGSPEVVSATDANIQFDVDPGQFVINVQFVKKHTGYTVVVDGFDTKVSENEDNVETTNETVYGCGPAVQLTGQSSSFIAIEMHRGIKEHNGTNSRVFSPCAISLLLEDGVRSPSKCTVSVYQEVLVSGQPIGGSQGKILLAESELKPFGVADNYVTSVFTPFPAAYSSEQSVYIENTSKVDAHFRLIKSRAALSMLGTGVATLPLNPLAGGALVGGFVLSYVPFVSNVPRYMQAFFKSNVAQSAAASPVGGAGATLQKLYEYVGSAPAPTRTKKRFKLTDLTRVLRTLGSSIKVRKNLSSEQLEADDSFVNEQYIWDWLLQAQYDSIVGLTSSEEAEIEAAIKKMDDATTEQERIAAAQNFEGIRERIYNRPREDSSSLVDVRGLTTLGKSRARIGIEVDIVDDDICEDSAKYHLACSNKRVSVDALNDSVEASALCGLSSSGLKQKIEDLWQAISDFECMLVRSLDTPNDQSWWARTRFGPVKEAVKNAALANKRTNNALTKALTQIEDGNIRVVLNCIGQKLYNVFGGRTRRQSNWVYGSGCVGIKDEDQPLDKLHQWLSDFESVRRPFVSSTDSKAFVKRVMPHRVYGKYMFPTGQQVEMGEVDTIVGDVVYNQSSSIKDCIQVLSYSSRSAAMAVGLVREKEETIGVRLKLVHATETPSFTSSASNTAPVDSFALVLQLPWDIRMLSAATPLTEKQRRVVEFQIQETVAKLGVLTLSNSEDGVIAMNFYAELWCEEIVRVQKLLEYDGTSARLAMVMEPAFKRATKRALKAIAFIEDVTRVANFGLYNIDDRDVAFVATEAGRDVYRLAKRMHLNRGANPVTSVVLMKHASTSIRKFASQFAGNTPSNMPSEPLSSLFMNPSCATDAFTRVKHIIDASGLPGMGLILSASSAAYPIALLHPDPPKSDDCPDPYLPSNLNVGDIVSRVLVRSTEMRIDTLDNDELESIEQRISGLELGSVQPGGGDLKPSGASYFIPYATGRLTDSRVSHVMFGSVPLFKKHFAVAAKEAIAALNDETSSADACGEYAIIQPYFDHCKIKDELQHPNVVSVDATNQKLKVRFVCSRMEKRESISRNDTLATNANSAASDFVLSDDSYHLSSVVATVAWNAERVVQSLALVAAHTTSRRVKCEFPVFTQGDVYDPIDDLSVACGLVLGLSIARYVLGDACPSLCMIGLSSRSVSVSETMRNGIDTLLRAWNTSEVGALRLSECSALVAFCMSIV
jgi:hypothetical protein